MTIAPDTRTIVLVHRPHRGGDSCDPAIDLDAPGISAMLTEYQRTRSQAALDALPLRPGKEPARFKIRRVSQGELRYILSDDSFVGQAHRAVSCGCHEFADAAGREHKARVVSESGSAFADSTWLDEIGDEYGGAALMEIGHAVIQWAQAPRSALAPFVSAPGLALPR